MDNGVLTEDDKREFVSDGDAETLIKRFAARKLSEVQVVWPLADGHTFTIHASRRLNTAEFETIGKLLRMARTVFVHTPASQLSER